MDNQNVYDAALQALTKLASDPIYGVGTLREDVDLIMQAIKKLHVENTNLKTQRGCWALFSAHDDEDNFIGLYESPDDVDVYYAKYDCSIDWTDDPHGGARRRGVLKARDGRKDSLYLARKDIFGEPGVPYAHLIDRLNKLEADLKDEIEKNARPTRFF